MTATLTVRTTSFGGLTPARGSFGMPANTKIEKGWLVGLDVNGRVVAGNTIAAGCLFGIGMASATRDNLTGSEAGGANDSINDFEVEYGIWAWESADIGVDDVGKVAYVVDNQTVSIDSDTDARGPAGIIHEWRDGKAWILMQPATRNLPVA